MGVDPARFQVVYARQALNELEEIWNWNATRYGGRHATEYVLFLESEISGLATEYLDGKVVEVNPSLRFLTIKRRSKVDGHVVVYRIDKDSQTVRVLHLFHTKQDWQNKI